MYGCGQEVTFISKITSGETKVLYDHIIIEYKHIGCCC